MTRRNGREVGKILTSEPLRDIITKKS
jgi:hypothetical protein